MAIPLQRGVEGVIWELKSLKTKRKRNQPCTCGSGLKFKRCHGDPAKLAVVKHIANEAMLVMIAKAKVENLSIEFYEEDYDKFISNPELVLHNFNKGYGLNPTN